MVCNVIMSNDDDSDGDSDNEICGVTIKHVENVMKTDHIGSHSDLNVSEYVPEVTSVSKTAEVDNLRTEQLTDDRLNKCFLLARQEKGKLFVKNNLLFHFDKIVGQNF